MLVASGPFTAFQQQQQQVDAKASCCCVSVLRDSLRPYAVLAVLVLLKLTSSNSKWVLHLKAVVPQRDFPHMQKQCLSQACLVVTG